MRTQDAQSRRPLSRSVSADPCWAGVHDLELLHGDGLAPVKLRHVRDFTVGQPGLDPKRHHEVGIVGPGEPPHRRLVEMVVVVVEIRTKSIGGRSSNAMPGGVNRRTPTVPDKGPTRWLQVGSVRKLTPSSWTRRVE